MVSLAKNHIILSANCLEPGQRQRVIFIFIPLFKKKVLVMGENLFFVHIYSGACFLFICLDEDV